MYGKNFLNDEKERNNIELSIIELFKTLKKDHIYYISISYFIKKLKYSKLEIYDAIHDLIDEEILELYEYERCPMCSQEQLIKEYKSKSVCSNCKEIYYSDCTIEKFKLIDKE